MYYNLVKHHFSSERINKMKRVLSIILSATLIAVSLTALSSCGCDHKWREATCSTPRTCSLCGKTEGEPLSGHKWQEATCTEAKYCLICDETEGTALGHDWEEADCENPKTCSVCGEKQGKPSGHNIVIDEEVPATCTETGLSEGEHCDVCGEVLVKQKKTDKIDHQEGDWTVTKPATLTNKGKEERLCTMCDKSLDSRNTEVKSLAVDGNVFNFTDKEFIEWFNDTSPATIKSAELEIFDDPTRTSYGISTTDGEAGVIIFDHYEADGAVCSIMLTFNEIVTADAYAIWIGTQISTKFSSDTAIEKIGAGGIYTSAGMTIAQLELGDDLDVCLLATEEYIDELLAD